MLHKKMLIELHSAIAEGIRLTLGPPACPNGTVIAHA